MLRAQLRVVWGDLGALRMQSVLVFVVIAAAAAMPILAVSVARSTQRPYERVLDQAHGAHVWLFDKDEDTLRLGATVPGVASWLAVAPMVFAVAVIGIAIPAAISARVRITDALRYE